MDRLLNLHSGKITSLLTLSRQGQSQQTDQSSTMTNGWSDMKFDVDIQNCGK